MKWNFRASLVVVLFCLVACSVAYAASTPASPSVEEKRGLQAAKALTKITGVAISPLLGVTVVGMYDYFHTPDNKRDKLGWYAQPHFWVPMLVVLIICGLKDYAGVVFPPGLKKPIDVLETVENKISGLVVAGTFVPFVASIFHSDATTTVMSSPVMHAGMFGMSFAPLLNILTIPLALTIFAIVWLVGHVTHVLILISPWGAVDAALKSMRTGVMAFLATVSFINPYMGAALSVVIIIISYFIAGWSFRLMIFGSVYIWDFFTFKRNRFQPDAKTNWMFTSRKIEKTPIRSYGKLSRTEAGELTFDYHPWLFLPAHKITLPKGDYIVGRGLICPEILTQEGEKTRTLLVMPPRYKKHEEEIARIYGIHDIRDIGLLKGLKAIWNWLKGGSSQPAAGAALTVT